MTGAYRYIIGNLDFQTIDLEPYQHGDTNITGIRLVSPEAENVQKVAKVLYETEEPFQNSKFSLINIIKISEIKIFVI